MARPWTVDASEGPAAFVGTLLVSLTRAGHPDGDVYYDLIWTQRRVEQRERNVERLKTWQIAREKIA